MRVPEHYLAVASNGEVFTDPHGVFSGIWNDLRMGYPEDIRLKKIAAHCMQIGQSGQYNYLRLMKRDDRVAMYLALSEFIKEVIAVVYLLNHSYAPFYKWMFYGMRSLPDVGVEAAELLEKLLAAADNEKVQLIEEICEMLIRGFRKQGITDCDDPYMVSQGESIHSHIRHEGLRNSNPWAAGG